MAILHDDEDGNDIVAIATFTTTNKSCNFFILCIRGNKIPSKTPHITTLKLGGSINQSRMSFQFLPVPNRRSPISPRPGFT